MALLVEDGTNVAGANSYTDLADARAYALARGKPLSADDAKLESDLIRSMDVLEAYRSQYKGVKTYFDQSLQFPRDGVDVDDVFILTTAIPSEIKSAQIQLAMALNAGIDIQPSQQRTRGVVTRKKIGPIETDYDVSGGISPLLTAVDALIAPLLRSSGFSLTTLRI